MAGKTIDMSRIKQLLQLKKLGLSNRQIAKELKISRDKTNEYVRMAELDSLDIDALLRLDDPVLEKRFHPGNPAYTDSRMETFLELLPDFVEQLSHKHVTRQLVWEEHFHAIEKPELRPLPATPYQMKRYAEVTVQQNGHVYLSCDKHYYSVPYTLIGNKAKIIFTSSLVKIYVRGECVATHRRDRSYGYTSQDEHLASNTLAFTRRSASYYKTRAKSVSESLFRLLDAMFSSTSATYPPEYYYRTCDMILRLQRNHPCDIFDEACDICTENRLFTGKRLENVIRTVQMSSQVRKSATAPDPTDHANMRGNLFFQ